MCAKPAHAAAPLRAAVLALCGLWLAPSPALAQAGAEAREYRIPAGPLSSALAALAAEAGVLFSADARLLDARTTPGLQGRYALPTAFARLLAGSGLELVQEGARYTLRRAPVPPAPAAAVAPTGPTPSTILPQIDVHALALPRARNYHSDPVVALARSDTSLHELPLAVTVIPRDLLQDLAVQSIADVLTYVPGVGAAQGEGNRDTPVFRGSSSTAGFLVDGLRDDVQYYRDLYNVERVEVLRGPNALLVGHGAVAGLINRVSKEPTWTTQRELGLQAGSFGHRRSTLDLSQVHGEQLASRLNLLYEDSHGYRDDFQLRRFGINPVVALRLPGQALLTLGYEHFQDRRTDDRGIASYQGRPVDTAASTFFGKPDDSLSWLRLNAFSGQLDLDLGAGLRLRSRLRHADYDKFFQNVFAGAVRENAGQLEVSLLAHNSRMRRRNTLSQTELNGTLNQGGVQHQWLAGVELNRQTTDNLRATGFFGDAPGSTVVYVPLAQPRTTLPVNFRTRPNDPNQRSEARLFALYLQDQIRWSPQWQLTLGLRHDQLAVDLQDRAANQALASRDQLWSPRAALLYQPVERLSLYASYGVGHAPRAGEQLTGLSPGNQDLQPEKFTNYELGLKWLVREGLEASAALYRLDRGNAAVTGSASDTQVLVDGQRTRGLELSLAGQWRPGWHVMGAYTWQDSRVRTTLSPAAPAGASMPHVPRHSFALWNRVTLDARWAAGLGVTLRGAVFTSTDNTVRLPGYARVDAALFYTVRSDLRLQLNLDNLLDRRYYAFAHSNNNITPGSPRALRLGLTLQF